MSGLQLIQPNDVKIFNLTAGKQMPSWLSERKRRQLLKKDVDLQKRIELIQDFEMPTATTSIKVSRDGSCILAAGTYKPRIRCYDVDQLSLKFERHLNCDVVAFELLSQDYSKLAMLQADRFVEVHASYGYHYRTRVPKNGRDMVYNEQTCDLYVVGNGSEINRLNLDQGRFMKPWMTDGPDINVCGMNVQYGLLGVGTTQGKLETFDPRTFERVAVLDVIKALPERALRGSDGLAQVTAMSFFPDGLCVGVGSSTGHVLLFDIRSSKPMIVKDHNYGLPIKKVFQHKLSNKILSADAKIVKIWDESSGKNYTSLESAAEINDMAIVPDSGMFFLATEEPKIGTYFIPTMGPAPKWCEYVDTIVEELEEDNQPVVYDDYKFVTKQDLEALGLSHLIGTNLLRAYMHGFFMDIRLYNKAKDIINPFAYDMYRRDKIKAKIEEGTASRLQLEQYRKKLPKINKDLAKRLLAHEMQEDKKKQARKAHQGADGAGAGAGAGEQGEDKAFDAANPLGDDRFRDLFNNPDFEIDQESHEYRLLHPQADKKRHQISDLLQSKFSAVLDDEESEEEGRASEDEGSTGDEEYEEREQRRREKEEAQKKKLQEQKQKQKQQQQQRQQKAGPQMFELKDGETMKPLQSFKDATQSKISKKKSFQDLVADDEGSTRTRISRAAGGGKVISFSVGGQKRKESEEGAGEGEEGDGAAHEDGSGSNRRKIARGVRGLGLSKRPKQHYWRGRPVSNK